MGSDVGGVMAGGREFKKVRRGCGWARSWVGGVSLLCRVHRIVRRGFVTVTVGVQMQSGFAALQDKMKETNAPMSSGCIALSRLVA